MAYMQHVGGEPRVWEWMAHNRARKIQEFYAEKLFEKRQAARVIQKRWRKYKNMMSVKEMRQCQQNRVRKRVAINRIYDLHRNIKVKKVYASHILMYNALNQSTAKL